MSGTLADLVGHALSARAQSHSPYSGFAVGAALLCTDGTVVTGCNVENASYGLTVCAERVALFRAIASDTRSFDAIAIVAPGPELPTPCGACRQVLIEFCRPDMPVLVACAESPEAISTFTLGALLPHAFHRDN